MRRRIASVAAVLALLVSVGCGGKDEAAPDTTSGAHLTDGEVADPCQLTYGARKCANVLSANWDTPNKPTEDKYRELAGLFPNPSRFASSPRRYDPACRDKPPMHKIRAAKDALRMPRTNGWAANIWVAMGKFEPDDNDGECPDSRYKVGGIVGAEYFLVAQLKLSPTPHNKGSTVGKWEMLAFTDNGASVRTLSTGDFVACTNLHIPELTLEQGEFENCDHKDIISFIADSLKISREDIIADIVQMRRDSSMVPMSPSNPTRALALPVRMRLFQSGAASNDNPAWISCALGCCISVEPDVPSVPRPPGDSTIKSSLRSGAGAFALR